MISPTFVFIDTETTGLDPAADRIIEVAALRVDAHLKIADRFESLVDPGVALPLQAQRLTGISPHELAGAPPFATVFERLARFICAAVVVGQNVGFDLGFLAAEARRCGARLPPWPSFDTLEASLLLYPELDRHALNVMAAHLGVEPPSHRALQDASVTVDLFAALCRRAASLATPERALLQAAGWTPLTLLEELRMPPDEAPPPLVAADPPQTGTPAALGCEADGWRHEFGEAGRLSRRMPGFRVREGQSDFAEACAALLAEGGVGLFEAGTGMGKSLAYLLPAAFAGASRGERVLVSTKTKALQRQLATHELPLVETALPAGWRWALLMGRENYLCRRQLEEAAAAAARRLPDRDRALALAYLLGRARRGEVDLSALPYHAESALPALSDLKRELRASAAACLRRRCPARLRCHWRLARARAEAAHLVCVNHALLLSGPGSVPSFEHAVIDEAHLLPEEATAAFSRSVDWATLDALLADLRGRGRQRSLAARLRAAAGSLEPERRRVCLAAADGLETAAADLPGHARALSAAVASLMALDERPDTAGYARTIWLRPGLREHPVFERFADVCSLVAEALSALAAAAGLASEALPEDHRESPQTRALAQEAGEAATLLAGLPEISLPGTVAWAGLESPDRWSLTRAPLSPGPAIREALWDRLRSAVLTSATLSVNDSFAYFRGQAGLARDLEVQEKVFPSPFDFRSHALLVVEHDPETVYSAPERPARQAAHLRRLIEATGGQLLALFTNRREMEAVAAAVGEHVEDEGVMLLAQGVHGSAAALADEFRAHPATVLLGVDALWTGQDFPGDTLVCLVIAKLPFPRQDALFQARRQTVEDEGGDWFRRFYLPQAVLRFRQGFGRLIRTETDRGVVVVLDHRLTQKTYGRDFLASLPDLQVVRAAPDELPEVVAAHLHRLFGTEPTAGS